MPTLSNYPNQGYSCLYRPSRVARYWSRRRHGRVRTRSLRPWPCDLPDASVSCAKLGDLWHAHSQLNSLYTLSTRRVTHVILDTVEPRLSESRLSETSIIRMLELEMICIVKCHLSIRIRLICVANSQLAGSWLLSASLVPRPRPAFQLCTRK